MKRFLTKIENDPPKGLHRLNLYLNEEVWKEVDCLSCANCCKKMTPTLTTKDKDRIADYLNLTRQEFETSFLEYDKEEKDWRMQKQPCYFLDQQTNMCRIYEIRPKDCAGFPHLTKKPMPDYMHVHKQNIAYCPATYRFVEKMMDSIEFVKPK